MSLVLLDERSSSLSFNLSLEFFGLNAHEITLYDERTSLIWQKDNYASGDVDDDDDDYSTTSSDSSFSEDGTLRAKRVGDDYTHMRPGFEVLG